MKLLVTTSILFSCKLTTLSHEVLSFSYQNAQWNLKYERKIQIRPIKICTSILEHTRWILIFLKNVCRLFNIITVSWLGLQHLRNLAYS